MKTPQDKCARCDFCAREGRKWFSGNWLCLSCWRRELRKLYEEAYA